MSPWVQGVYRHSRDRLEKGYTDTLVYVGLTRREAKEDFVDHYRREPERFVGFNVEVTSVEQVARGWLRGRRIRDFEISHRCFLSRNYTQALRELEQSVAIARMVS